MNERIKELIVSLEPDVFMTYKGYLYHSGDPKVLEHSDPEPLYTQQECQKFAELIVQDVLKIVKNNTPKPDPYGERARYDAQEYGECVANDIRDDIKYLFGVEE